MRYLDPKNDLTFKNATETISPELFEVQEIREAIELLQESAYSQSELLTYDKYWDSISVERTMLSDSFVEGKIEGKSEGINLMIINGYKAGISTEILSSLAQISNEGVTEILRNHGLI